MYTKYEENPFAGFFNTTIVGKIFVLHFILGSNNFFPSSRVACVRKWAILENSC